MDLLLMQHKVCNDALKNSWSLGRSRGAVQKWPCFRCLLFYTVFSVLRACDTVSQGKARFGRASMLYSVNEFLLVTCFM